MDLVLRFWKIGLGSDCFGRGILERRREDFMNDARREGCAVVDSMYYELEFDFVEV